jgi:leucine dehydrogenase
MSIFDSLNQFDHEQIVFCSDKSVGLKAIIAVHNTVLGPALGGTRMWMYKTDEDALKDALRLSRGMTYKSAIMGLNLGGGKAVILADPKKDKSESLWRTYGRYIEGLAGRYITAEDVGTDTKDMEYIRMETKYVSGITQAVGGSGDPSPVTALGVYVGLKACVNEVYGNDSLRGKKIVVQGAGHVGYYICQHLHKEGATIYISDIYEDRVKNIVDQFKAIPVAADNVYDVEADIFCPSALGAIINDDTIPRFKFKIIGGAANNQLLEEEKHGKMLIEKDIFYAPDYVINGGGIINVYYELEGYVQERALKHAEGIYDILKNVFNKAKKENIPTYVASNKLAEERIRKIGQVRRLYAGKSDFSGRLGELNKFSYRWRHG